MSSFQVGPWIHDPVSSSQIHTYACTRYLDVYQQCLLRDCAECTCQCIHLQNVPFIYFLSLHDALHSISMNMTEVILVEQTLNAAQRRHIPFPAYACYSWLQLTHLWRFFWWRAWHVSHMSQLHDTLCHWHWIQVPQSSGLWTHTSKWANWANCAVLGVQACLIVLISSIDSYQQLNAHHAW